MIDTTDAELGKWLRDRLPVIESYMQNHPDQYTAEMSEDTLAVVDALVALLVEAHSTLEIALISLDKDGARSGAAVLNGQGRLTEARLRVVLGGE